MCSIGVISIADCKNIDSAAQRRFNCLLAALPSIQSCIWKTRSKAQPNLILTKLSPFIGRVKRKAIFSFDCVLVGLLLRALALALYWRGAARDWAV